MRKQIGENPYKAVSEQMVGNFIHVEIMQDQESTQGEQDWRADLELAVAAEIHFCDEDQPDHQRIPASGFLHQDQGGEREQRAKHHAAVTQHDTCLLYTSRCV